MIFMEIIKQGRQIDPEERIRYFICDVCECEFKTDKVECRARHFDSPNTGTVVYYTHQCPNCKSMCFGMRKSEYTRRKLAQLKEQEEKANGQIV